MLSTWVYQYVHFSDRCGACEGCVHGGKCFDSTPLPPSPFLAPSPPWLPRLSFDLTFLENENRTASISVQLVKGQPRLMRWADGGTSVVFTYGGSDALWLLCLGDSPVVLHDRRGGGTSARATKLSVQDQPRHDHRASAGVQVRVARRRHRLGTERHRGGVQRLGSRTRTLQRRTVEGDAARAKGAFTAESAHHTGQVERIKEQKRRNEASEEERGGGSSSEASENEARTTPRRSPPRRWTTRTAHCAPRVSRVSPFPGRGVLHRAPEQRAGIIERTRIMRKLLRDFAIDFGHIGGRIGGEDEKATIKVESSPASFSIKADDEPLSVLANAAIEEVRTKISGTGTRTSPSN